MPAKLFYLLITLLILIAFNCAQNPLQNKEISTNEASAQTSPTPPQFQKARKEKINLSGENLKNAKERIAKVAFHSNSLWTLGKFGVLLQIDLIKKKAAPFEFGQYVADILVDEKNDFYVLAGEKENSGDWRILKKDGADWLEIDALKIKEKPVKKDEEARRIIGLTKYRNGFLVLTQDEIYWQKNGDGWESVELQNKARLGLQTPFVATGDGFVYFGLNHGEWGGGLWQINIKNGQTEVVEKKSHGKICFKPLDQQCDPVTSIVKDSENPNAVLAGIGLRHFSEHGRIVKVAAGDVSVVFNKTYSYDEKSRKLVPENPCDGKNEPENLESDGSEGVFGMQSDGQSVWLVTGRAVYKLAGGKLETCSPMPEKLEQVDGIAVSEEIQGIILVGTDINWEKSLSGTTPLIAIKR